MTRSMRQQAEAAAAVGGIAGDDSPEAKRNFMGRVGQAFEKMVDAGNTYGNYGSVASQVDYEMTEEELENL